MPEPRDFKSLGDVKLGMEKLAAEFADKTDNAASLGAIVFLAKAISKLTDEIDDLRKNQVFVD